MTIILDDAPSASTIGYVNSGTNSSTIWTTSYDDNQVIIKSLLLMNNMLKYFKDNIQDEKFLNMIEEFEENLFGYIEDDKQDEDDLFNL